MILQIIIFAGLSGITIILGGLLAKLFNHHIEETPIKYVITHTIMSFGGGIILSALALVLVPKGMEHLDLLPLCLFFVFGTVSFFLMDKYLAAKGGKTATLLAMMMDFVPESIVLGAVFVLDHNTAILLALFIGIQNLPEAFNAYRDLILSGFNEKLTLIIFTILSFVGILCALFGYYYLSDLPKFTAYLMIFASGGIIYLLFQDITPDSKLKNTWFPSLGASLGFLIGIIGEKII